MLKDAPITAYIPVSDVARGRQFYEEKIGLRPKQENAEGVLYECGNGALAFMYRSQGAGASKASTAFWTVKDVVAEMAALRGKGIAFEEYDMPGVKTVNGIATGCGNRTAWFKDADGNILAISQRIE